MISYNTDANCVLNHLLRQIKIKETQLKIAHESHMLFVAQALETQLSDLRSQLSDAPDPQLQALMSLVDNFD